jgi:L-alanine-DL-glutamate epimerase-like enolase superfamily enzyme
MRRRQFLRASALGFASAATGIRTASGAKGSPATDDLRRFRITSVTGFRHVCPRPKLVGKNSHLDVHGNTTSENCLRIATDQGVEGIGVGNLAREAAQSLVGMSLDQLWAPDHGAVGPIGRADHALFDLVGKALGKPSWELIGGRGPEWVPVYDGSIYFADLLPEHLGRGISRILDEVEQGMERGHRAFKIKVGRGYKWMEKSAGFDRDVEVIRAIRRLVGPEVLLMADSNNGFDLDETLRFLDAIETSLFFAEEMFPEDVKLDLRLKDEIARRGLKTLVADGESAREVDHFDPYLDAGALDVLQPDIRAFGLSLQWELSRRIEASGTPARLAPHNWGSNLGVFMQAILARGIPNFLSAEWDTSTSDLFDTSAFSFRDGLLRVPDTPGCGLVLRDDVFSARYASEAWTVSAE